MHPTDQPLKIQMIQEEDVAYAAFHNTVCDVHEELTKYGEDTVLADAKLRTALDELDVLRSSIDASYNILLDAAVSPISSRLRRSKANVEIRITDLKNLLTNKNMDHIAAEQRKLCSASDESQINVAATKCDDDDSGVQSYNIPVLLLTSIVLLTVVIDSKQSCPMNPDPIDNLTVTPDEDRQMERDTVLGCETDDALYQELNMTLLYNVDCSAAVADNADHVCESRAISGLKHRW